MRNKELGQEAKFIRHEEHKAKKRGRREEFWKLREHRVKHVRDHARAGLLAYAFLRDVPYRKVERKTYDTEEHLNRIKKETLRLIKKFGEDGKDYKKDLDMWFAS